MKPSRTGYFYANYEEHPDPSHRPMYLARILRRLRADGSVTTILDAGCGGADFAQGLALNGYMVYGVDLSATAVKAAEARRCGSFVISSVYDDLLKPFNLREVDAVISIEVIEHLYNPRLFVRRAREALKPGGLLIVTTPYWGYLKNILLAITNRTDLALTALWDGGHIKHFSRKALTRLMAENAFEPVSFEGCGEGFRAWLPYLWSSMLMIFRKVETHRRAERREDATNGIGGT